LISRDAFGDSLELVTRELNALSLRYAITAANIANADTPNYKRSFLNFESRLKQALESEAMPIFPLATTHPRHIPLDGPKDWREVQPRSVLDFQTTTKNNGNNVDIEEEAMTSLKTQLLYTTLSQSISGAINRVNIVIGSR
jgi:flagellar basal-body rod protein FlgB